MEMEKKKQGHLIERVEENSIAMEMGVEAGDRLLAIDGQKVIDIFDYQYMLQNDYIEVLIGKAGGEEWLLEVDKDSDEDLGLVFDNGLMDDYRSCQNKCVFCFIDQMPEGMRKSLYFKDDDSRLSFLQGNYVTLTNMSDNDINRIIQYHLSPINISFHTVNPELRCRMLNNRFAGESLKKVKRLFDAGIGMNGQIVLCKGMNDKDELDRSIQELSNYLPHLASLSVVPVGLTKYRGGLYPLEPFSTIEADEVLNRIHSWQKRLYTEHGVHFVHASDEWYLMADRPLPRAERYDGFPQLENGVGMLRLLIDEFDQMMDEITEDKASRESVRNHLSIATGKLASSVIRELTDKLCGLYPGLNIRVHVIKNLFFGERITVSGLLTGQDIVEQLKGKELGSRLLLPENVLRSGEDCFLDDMTVADVERALQVKVDIVKSSGRDLVNTILERE